MWIHNMILQISVEMSYFQISLETDSSFIENLLKDLEITFSYAEGELASLLMQCRFP